MKIKSAKRNSRVSRRSIRKRNSSSRIMRKSGRKSWRKSGRKSRRKSRKIQRSFMGGMTDFQDMGGKEKSQEMTKADMAEAYYEYMETISGPASQDINTYLFYLIGDPYLKNKKISTEETRQIINDLKNSNLGQRFIDSYNSLQSHVKTIDEQGGTQNDNITAELNTSGDTYAIEKASSRKQSHIKHDVMSPLTPHIQSPVMVGSAVSHPTPRFPSAMQVGGTLSATNLTSGLQRVFPRESGMTTPEIMDLVRKMFQQISNGRTCTLNGLFKKLDVPQVRTRGHWLNRVRTVNPNPLPSMSPSIYTNLAGYLWTINACGGQISLYSKVTDILRTHDQQGFSDYQYFLTGLYFCIMTTTTLDTNADDYQPPHLPLWTNGHALRGYGPLWRGEARVYSPEIINLSNNLSGNVRITDICNWDRRSGYTLKSNIRTGYRGVFTGVTATTDNIRLAGYFCTSKNAELDEDLVQVIYNFEGIKGEYSAYMQKLQALGESEILCLPGVVYTVEKIDYLPPHKAALFWSSNPPGSAGNTVSSLLTKRHLLLIKLNVDGVSGHLPGWDSNTFTQEVCRYISPHNVGHIPGHPDRVEQRANDRRVAAVDETIEADEGNESNEADECGESWDQIYATLGIGIVSSAAFLILWPFLGVAMGVAGAGVAGALQNYGYVLGGGGEDDTKLPEGADLILYTRTVNLLKNINEIREFMVVETAHYADNDKEKGIVLQGSGKSGIKSRKK
jgi:hypothetical protein